MSTLKIGSDVFESYADVIDVTSLHRADTSWRHTDAKSHEHRWYMNGQPASDYNPSGKFTVPTLVWVKDGEAYWYGDDEPHDIGHLECRECGEHIEPRYTVDRTPQYIQGLRSYYINGEPVSSEEFERRRRVTREEFEQRPPMA